MKDQFRIKTDKRVKFAPQKGINFLQQEGEKYMENPPTKKNFQLSRYFRLDRQNVCDHHSRKYLVKNILWD